MERITEHLKHRHQQQIETSAELKGTGLRQLRQSLCQDNGEQHRAQKEKKDEGLKTIRDDGASEPSLGAVYNGDRCE